MSKYTIHQAKTHFSRLLKQVANGEEIIILHRDKPVAKVIPLRPLARRVALLGDLRGRIKIGRQFDVIPDEFEKYI
jgi:prevent-host-death family protein